MAKIEMEIDFDKEVDTLLRKARSDGPVLVGDAAAPGHLDADEISAFAENMVPERSKALYMAHMADCDRCRKILSNVLVMNAGNVHAAAAAPGVITIAERSLPWYKRLMLFPNLSYVMGGLVLVFAGFLGYTVLQSTGGGDSAVVSQIADGEAISSGPSFQSDSEIPASAPASNMANANASIATDAFSNTAANRSTEPGAPGERGPRADSRDTNNFAIDGADATAGTPPPPPPAMEAAPKTLAKERDEAVAKAETRPSAGAAAQAPAKNDTSLLRQAPSAATQSQSGPMRNNDNQYNRQLENLDLSEAEKKKAARSGSEESSGRRAVGGRTFERKQGVWYDVAYQGTRTTNVRRGSSEFNRLDSGLKSIANSLTGTIVVVWGSKAYRIQ